MATADQGGKRIFSLSNKQLEELIAAIEQAIEWHQCWYKRLLRSLIANVPACEEDLDDNAHALCEFIRFNKLPSSSKNLHPYFAEIEIAHQKMHHGAKVLLSLNEANSKIPVNLLDQFHEDLDRVRYLFEAVNEDFSKLLHNRDPLTVQTTALIYLAICERSMSLRKESHLAVR